MVETVGWDVSETFAHCTDCDFCVDVEVEEIDSCDKCLEPMCYDCKDVNGVNCKECNREMGVK
jgi:hypothetical protein